MNYVFRLIKPADKQAKRISLAEKNTSLFRRLESIIDDILSSPFVFLNEMLKGHFKEPLVLILRNHSKDKIIQAMEDNMDAFTSLLPL